MEREKKKISCRNTHNYQLELQKNFSVNCPLKDSKAVIGPGMILFDTSLPSSIHDHSK